MSFLTLEIDRAGHTAVVHCHGKWVAGVTDVLSIKVQQLIPDTKRIVLDLKELNHMDSTGLGTLVRLYVSPARSAATLELMHLGKQVRHLLGLTHLLSVFTIVGEHNIKMG